MRTEHLRLPLRPAFCTRFRALPRFCQYRLFQLYLYSSADCLHPQIVSVIRVLSCPASPSSLVLSCKSRAPSRHSFRMSWSRDAATPMSRTCPATLGLALFLLWTKNTFILLSNMARADISGLSLLLTWYMLFTWRCSRRIPNVRFQFPLTISRCGAPVPAPLCLSEFSVRENQQASADGAHAYISAIQFAVMLP